MSRKSFEPKECIAALNNMKKAIQIRETPVSKETIVQGLISCGLPANNNFWPIFKNSGIIKEVERGKYVFTSNEPIFVGHLETIKRKYQELIKKYHNKVAKTNNVVKEVTEFPKIVEHKDMIQSAIDLLKENGYEIFAPVGVLYKKI